MTYRPLRIAVCGIDGSGKSSLLSDLRETEQFRSARVLKRENRNHADRLIRLHQIAEGAIAAGPLALAQRWAYAFDFLAFVQGEVSAYWSGDVPVLLDRWTPCLVAWCRMLSNHQTKPIEAIARRIPEPDAIVYLEVEPMEAQRRINARGRAKPDETLEVLTKFRAAYAEVLAELKVPHLCLPDLPRLDRLQMTLKFLDHVTSEANGRHS